MNPRDRVFWETIRRALLLIVKAIETRYLAPEPEEAAVNGMID